MDAVELEAGGVASSTTAVSDTGRYRLHLGVATSRTAAADWSAASNAFEVR